jgi:predicted secreted protein
MPMREKAALGDREFPVRRNTLRLVESLGNMKILKIACLQMSDKAARMSKESQTCAV